MFCFLLFSFKISPLFLANRGDKVNCFSFMKCILSLCYESALNAGRSLSLFLSSTLFPTAYPYAKGYAEGYQGNGVAYQKPAASGREPRSG